MNRITKALNARREALQNDEAKGFTLIELLVVVIIIGILAAIAIPIYLGVQGGAKDAAVQTDVTNGKIAAVAWQTANPTALTYPALNTLGTFGFTQSSNTGSLAFSATTVAANFPQFCIVGVGKTTNTTFYVTDSTGIVQGVTNKPAGC